MIETWIYQEGHPIVTLHSIDNSSNRFLVRQKTYKVSEKKEREGEWVRKERKNEFGLFQQLTFEIERKQLPFYCRITLDWVWQKKKDYGRFLSFFIMNQEIHIFIGWLKEKVSLSSLLSIHSLLLSSSYSSAEITIGNDLILDSDVQVFIRIRYPPNHYMTIIDNLKRNSSIFSQSAKFVLFITE